MKLNIISNVTKFFTPQSEVKDPRVPRLDTKKTDLFVPVGIKDVEVPPAPRKLDMPTPKEIFDESSTPLSISSDNVNIKLTGINRNEQNVQNGIAFSKSVDDAMGEIMDLLYKIRNLAAQAAQDYNERTQNFVQLQKMVSAMSKEITRIGCETSFDGKHILSGFTKEAEEVDNSLHFSLPLNDETKTKVDFELPPFTLEGLAKDSHLDLPPLLSTEGTLPDLDLPTPDHFDVPPFPEPVDLPTASFTDKKVMEPDVIETPKNPSFTLDPVDYPDIAVPHEPDVILSSDQQTSSLPHHEPFVAEAPHLDVPDPESVDEPPVSIMAAHVPVQPHRVDTPAPAAPHAPLHAPAATSSLTPPEPDNRVKPEPLEPPQPKEPLVSAPKEETEKNIAPPPEEKTSYLDEKKADLVTERQRQKDEARELVEKKEDKHPKAVEREHERRQRAIDIRHEEQIIMAERQEQRRHEERINERSQDHVAVAEDAPATKKKGFFSRLGDIALTMLHKLKPKKEEEATEHEILSKSDKEEKLAEAKKTHDVSDDGLMRDDNGEISFSVSSPHAASKTLRSVSILLSALKAHRAKMTDVSATFENASVHKSLRGSAQPSVPQQIFSDPASFMLSQANMRSSTAFSLLK